MDPTLHARTSRALVDCFDPWLFFERVPAGDAYVLKSVLHDWDDPTCNAILKNCRAVMRTAAEYRKLFEAAGFELTRIVPTDAPVSVIESVPR